MPDLVLPRLVATALVAVGIFAGPAVATPTPQDIEFFESKIRPLLVRNCHRCHDSEERAGGLDLTSAQGFSEGAATGPIVSPGDPSSSRLIEVLSYEGRLKMPPDRRLPPTLLADVRTWIERGAPWPGADLDAVPLATRKQNQPFTAEEKAFWFYQPIADPEPPEVDDESWVRTDIDRFILAALERDGLTPAPRATATTLLRRATFDLTGLPPEVETIDELGADASPSAFDEEVDRLLESRRYGERYGRHWLDVARYADSTGNDEDHRYPWAYRYRDYVIRAFNDDLSYDQFVREQIAGDLLPPPAGEEINRHGIVATGFLALGPKAIAQQDKQRMLYDVWDEQVDVTSRAFMGLTIACARCHDHKFDPIPTGDYYSLVGMFASTRSFEEPSTHVSQLLFVPLVDQRNEK